MSKKTIGEPTVIKMLLNLSETKKGETDESS